MREPRKVHRSLRLTAAMPTGMAVVEASIEYTKDGAVETQTIIPFPRRRIKLMKVPNSQSPITEQRSEGRKKSPSKNVAHTVSKGWAMEKGQSW